MSKDDLLQIIADALEVEVDDTVSMGSAVEWDSLAHLTILSGIDEKTDGASSEIDGIARCKSYADFYAVLVKNALLRE